MQLGLIGLGKMGANMARRLHRAGIEVVAFDLDAAALAELAREGVLMPAASSAELIAALQPRRHVWLMLPAGRITETVVTEIAELIDEGDVIIDGANSNFNDSMRRHAALAARGVGFIDAGVSGGVWGLNEGYTLMLGGEPDAIASMRRVFEALAPALDRGWIHCGPGGSGHYVKMVHNGIEYGMMQAYAEGFALMRARTDFDLDLAGIAESWRHGSVIRSWLLDLTADALASDQHLEEIAAVVPDSGEGRWTVIEAVERGVPTPVISAALAMRFSSQGGQDYASKILAVMRNQFGGHATLKDRGQTPTSA